MSSSPPTRKRQTPDERIGCVLVFVDQDDSYGVDHQCYGFRCDSLSEEEYAHLDPFAMGTSENDPEDFTTDTEHTCFILHRLIQSGTALDDLFLPYKPNDAARLPSGIYGDTKKRWWGPLNCAKYDAKWVFNLHHGS